MACLFSYNKPSNHLATGNNLNEEVENIMSTSKRKSNRALVDKAALAGAIKGGLPGKQCT